MSPAHTARVSAVNDVSSSIAYYKMNRGQAGFKQIVLTPKASDCDSTNGFKREKLFRWPGSVAGYQKAGKFYTGVDPTGTLVPAKDFFFADYWKGARFCVSRMGTA